VHYKFIPQRAREPLCENNNINPIVNSNKNFLADLSQKIRVKDNWNQRLRESQNLGYFGMDKTIPKKRDFHIPALPLIEEITDKAKATDVIEFLAKQHAGSTSTGPTYKVKVQRSNEGTVSKWIAIRKSIKELWEQNSITSQPDRIANICSIL
jgi:hypothetical protein